MDIRKSVSKGGHERIHASLSLIFNDTLLNLICGPFLLIYRLGRDVVKGDGPGQFGLRSCTAKSFQKNIDRIGESHYIGVIFTRRFK